MPLCLSQSFIFRFVSTIRIAFLLSTLQFSVAVQFLCQILRLGRRTSINSLHVALDLFKTVQKAVPQKKIFFLNISSSLFLKISEICICYL